MANLGSLLDPKIVKLLLALRQSENQFFHITQLSKEAKVPTATTFRLISQLTESGLIEQSLVGKLKIYRYHKSEENDSLMRLIK